MIRIQSSNFLFACKALVPKNAKTSTYEITRYSVCIVQEHQQIRRSYLTYFLMFSSKLLESSFPLADILDRVSPKLELLGLSYECLGGGRIRHDSQDQKIHIYGYSVVSPLLRVCVCTLLDYLCERSHLWYFKR